MAMKLYWCGVGIQNTLLGGQGHDKNAVEMEFKEIKLSNYIVTPKNPQLRSPATELCS